MSSNTPLLSHAQDGNAATNKARVQKMLSDWKDGNGSALLGLLSDDVQWTIVGHSAVAGTVKGKQDLQSKILQPFAARFSESHDKFKPTVIHSVTSEGEMVAALFEGKGLANGGYVYANTYAWFLHFEGGLAHQVTAFFDSVEFNRLWNEVHPSSWISGLCDEHPHS